MSRKYSNKARSLLQDRPYLAEWLNQCGMCQRIGYKPQTPMTNENIKAHGVTSPSERLRNNYDVLELNDYGICEDCRNLID
jgi:hypothetical protein